jgi:hypothetical protein
MNAKTLKDWVNNLPDDALNSKSIKESVSGMLSGKVISSLCEKGKI